MSLNNDKSVEELSDDEKQVLEIIKAKDGKLGKLDIVSECSGKVDMPEALEILKLLEERGLILTSVSRYYITQ